MKISIEIIWNTKNKIIAVVIILILLFVCILLKSRNTTSVRENNLTANPQVRNPYFLPRSQSYDQYSTRTQIQPTSPDILPSSQPTQTTETIQTPRSARPKAQYFSKSVENQNLTQLPMVQDQPQDTIEKKSIVPEGLVITQSKWVVLSEGPDTYRYNLIVTLKNVSQVTFKEVSVECSVLTINENKKYGGNGKSVSNLAPGDVWDFNACGYAFSNKVDFYNTYYSRIDKITATPDRP